MRIAILGATGQTGRELVTLGLAKGHQITALARNPTDLQSISSPLLQVVRGDVTSPESVTDAAAGTDVLISALGISKGGDAQTLVLGAKAVIASGVTNIVWLGAFGTGASETLIARPFRSLLGLILKNELSAKVEADTLIQTSGFTVVHAGRLTNKPATNKYRLVRADEAPHRQLPPSVSRSDVAALMISAAEQQRHLGQTVVVLPT